MNTSRDNESVEEMFDVVDGQDRVIGQAPRSRVHAQGLMHRAVHVFVLNSRDQLLVQQRSAEKDEYPLRYTSSASGHLASGESYADAAVRELWEEVGLEGGLEYQTTLPAGPATANEHSALYLLRSDATPVFDPVEILDGRYEDFGTLREQMARKPRAFTPPFLELFQWYVAQTTE
ncbi:MAG: NUDIX domain-containing protein [Planctomycetaceae bacterium]